MERNEVIHLLNAIASEVDNQHGGSGNRYAIALRAAADMLEAPEPPAAAQGPSREEIRAALDEVVADERYHYKAAIYQVNGPLALIQVDLKARASILAWVLGEKAPKPHMGQKPIDAARTMGDASKGGPT